MNQRRSDRRFAARDLARDGLVQSAAGLFVVIAALWAFGCSPGPSPDPSTPPRTIPDDTDNTLDLGGAAVTLPADAPVELSKLEVVADPESGYSLSDQMPPPDPSDELNSYLVITNDGDLVYEALCIPGQDKVELSPHSTALALTLSCPLLQVQRGSPAAQMVDSVSTLPEVLTLSTYIEQKVRGGQLSVYDPSDEEFISKVIAAQKAAVAKLAHYYPAEDTQPESSACLKGTQKLTLSRAPVPEGSLGEPESSSSGQIGILGQGNYDEGVARTFVELEVLDDSDPRRVQLRVKNYMLRYICVASTEGFPIEDSVIGTTLARVTPAPSPISTDLLGMADFWRDVFTDPSHYGSSEQTIMLDFSNGSYRELTIVGPGSHNRGN